MLLDRDNWCDVAHDLDWTLSYVEHEDAFPNSWTGSNTIPREAWRGFLDEAGLQTKTAEFSDGNAPVE